MSFNTQAAIKTVSNGLIRIKDIEISNRFRRDVGDVSDLTISIKNNGLIHPISVTKDGRLVAGRRRIEAFKKLGLEEIPVTITDIAIKEDGEIDENSIRKDFTPEEMIAVKKYLDAREVNLESRFQIMPGNNRPPALNNQGRPNFGLPKRSKRIAKAIGISDTNLRKLEAIHEAASNDPGLFGDLWHKVNSNKISAHKAFNTYKRISQKEQLIKESQQFPSSLLNNVQLIHGNFINESKNILDNSVDLIFTDPPYDEKSLPIYTHLAVLGKRVLKMGGSLVTYAGTYAIPEVLYYMKEAGLNYWWIITVKQSGQSARFYPRHVSIKCKQLLWFINGDEINAIDFVSDCIDSSAPDKMLHKWQQSTMEPEHIISRLTAENQVVLDPMLGSGSTAIAALKLSRRFIGIELEEDTFRIAAARINQWLTCKEDQQIKPKMVTN